MLHPRGQLTRARLLSGQLCHDFVKAFWAPTRTAVQFLHHIYNLLANPDIGRCPACAMLYCRIQRFTQSPMFSCACPDESPVAPEIAAQMRDNIEAFETRARSSGDERK